MFTCCWYFFCCTGSGVATWVIFVVLVVVGRATGNSEISKPPTFSLFLSFGRLLRFCLFFFFLLQPACLGAQNWFWTRLCCSCGPSFVVVAILCIVVVRASCRKWKLIRSPQISAQGYRIRIRTQIRATCVTDLIIIIYVHMYVLIYIHILVCMRAYMCAKEL